MTFLSFTKTFHRRTYPAIDPTRPELSAGGKTVIITGGSAGGIGAAIAESFAKAGATNIAVLGRTEASLQKTKSHLEEAYPNTKVIIAIADVSDNESVGAAAHEIRAAIGAWDIFIHAAGYLPDSTTLTGADVDDWWKGFEINVKFCQIFSKHFMTKCRPNSTFISLSSGAIHAPADMMKGMSSYSASKLAALRLNDFLAAQYCSLRVFSVHPGIVDTPMSRKHKSQDGGDRDFDEPGLAGNFMVWLASSDSEFLRGRFLWVNWDIEELKAMKAEIEGHPTLLKAAVGGWPFEHAVE